MVELVILENTRVLFDAASKLADSLPPGRDGSPDAEKQIGEFLETLYNARLDELKSVLSVPQGTASPDDEQYYEHLAERYDVEYDGGNGGGQEGRIWRERINPFVAKAQTHIRSAGKPPPADMVPFSNLLEGASRDDRSEERRVGKECRY